MAIDAVLSMHHSFYKYVSPRPVSDFRTTQLLIRNASESVEIERRWIYWIWNKGRWHICVA